MNSNTALNNIINNIEKNFNTGPYDSKIKSNLNYYSESHQKSLEAKLIHGDLFPKTELRPYRPTLLPSTQPSVQETEIRKLIEKEIEPYLFSLKNELRLLADGHIQQLGDYGSFKPEINKIKETGQENKRLILILQEEMEKKFMESNLRFHELSKKFDEVKATLGDNSRRMKMFEGSYLNFQENILQLDDLKGKVSAIEQNSEKFFTEVEKTVSLNFNSKVKNIESTIENLKSSNQLLAGNISTLASSFGNLESSFQNNKNSSNEITKDIEELKGNQNTINFNYSSIVGKYENILTSLENFNEKFSNLNRNHSSMADSVKNFQTTNEELLKKFERLKEEVGTINLAASNSKETKSLNENFRTNLRREVAELINDYETKQNLKFTKMIEAKIEGMQPTTEIKEVPMIEEKKSNKELIEQSLSEMIKQILNVNKEIDGLKNETNRHEDNFESIQDNFDKLITKLNKIENDDELVNEIIKTLSVNMEINKQNVEKQFGSIPQWQNSLVESLTNNQIELKNELEKKLNQFSCQCQKQHSSLVSPKSPMKVPNSLPPLTNDNTKQLESKMIIIEEIIKELHRVLNEKQTKIDINTNKITELEDKLQHMFNYFDPKVEELVEMFKVLTSKSGDMINLNNVTNSHFLPPQNYHQGLVHYTTGLVSNLNRNFLIKFNTPAGCSFEIWGQSTQPEMKKNSKRNDIDIKWLKDQQGLKYKKNVKYISNNLINQEEVQQEFKGYLKKYLTPQKHCENILEIEFEYDYLTYPDMFENNLHLQPMSKSDEENKGKSKNLEDLHALEFNNNDLIEDHEDFDDFDDEDIQDILYRTDKKM